MPNKNMYIDESTQTKAFKALFGDGILDFGQVLAADERLKAAGIQFAEEIEPRKLGSRTKAQEEADAKAGTVDPGQPWVNQTPDVVLNNPGNSPA